MPIRALKERRRYRAYPLTPVDIASPPSRELIVLKDALEKLEKQYPWIALREAVERKLNLVKGENTFYFLNWSILLFYDKEGEIKRIELSLDLAKEKDKEISEFLLKMLAKPKHEEISSILEVERKPNSWKLTLVLEKSKEENEGEFLAQAERIIKEVFTKTAKFIGKYNEN